MNNFVWLTKNAQGGPKDPNYTGVVFGNYFIQGKKVDEATYHNYMKSNDAKQNSVNADKANASRKNSDLDDFMSDDNVGTDAAKKKQEAEQRQRANESHDALAEFLGDAPKDNPKQEQQGQQEQTPKPKKEKPQPKPKITVDSIEGSLKQIGDTEQHAQSIGEEIERHLQNAPKGVAKEFQKKYGIKLDEDGYEMMGKKYLGLHQGEYTGPKKLPMPKGDDAPKPVDAKSKEIAKEGAEKFGGANGATPPPLPKKPVGDDKKSGGQWDWMNETGFNSPRDSVPDYVPQLPKREDSIPRPKRANAKNWDRTQGVSVNGEQRIAKFNSLEQKRGFAAAHAEKHPKGATYWQQQKSKEKAKVSMQKFADKHFGGDVDKARTYAHAEYDHVMGKLKGGKGDTPVDIGKMPPKYKELPPPLPKDRAALEASLGGKSTPPPLPSKNGATPPPLPQKTDWKSFWDQPEPQSVTDATRHEETQQTALGKANAAMEEAKRWRSGGSKDHAELGRLHQEAYDAINEHEQEGHKAIDRMALEKYGYSDKAKQVAEQSKKKFSEKLGKARERLKSATASGGPPGETPTQSNSEGKFDFKWDGPGRELQSPPTQSASTESVEQEQSSPEETQPNDVVPQEQEQATGQPQEDAVSSSETTSQDGGADKDNASADWSKNPFADAMSFGKNGMTDSFSNHIEGHITKNGDIPSAEKNSQVGRAWSEVKKQGFHKHPESAKRFAAALRDAYAMQNQGKSQSDAWKEALNKHFSGISSPASPQEATNPSASATPSTGNATAQPTPEQSDSAGSATATQPTKQPTAMPSSASTPQATPEKHPLHNDNAHSHAPSRPKNVHPDLAGMDAFKDAHPHDHEDLRDIHANNLARSAKQLEAQIHKQNRRVEQLDEGGSHPDDVRREKSIQRLLYGMHDNATKREQAQVESKKQEREQAKASAQQKKVDDKKTADAAQKKIDYDTEQQRIRDEGPGRIRDNKMRTAVKDYVGDRGIDPTSIKESREWKDEVAKAGLLHLIKNGGFGIDEVAEDLERSGYLKVPHDRHGDDYLMELLIGDADHAHADHSQEIMHAEANYQKKLQEIHDGEEHGEREIAGATRRGEDEGLLAFQSELESKNNGDNGATSSGEGGEGKRFRGPEDRLDYIADEVEAKADDYDRTRDEDNDFRTDAEKEKDYEFPFGANAEPEDDDNDIDDDIEWDIRNQKAFSGFFRVKLDEWRVESPLMWLTKGDDSSLGDAHVRADLMADIVGGLFGDESIRLFEGKGWVQKMWNAIEHPRGKNGRFIPKGSGEAFDATKASIKSILNGKKDSTAHKQLLDHLSILTVKQLHDLKKEYGLKASASLKSDLVKKIGERLSEKHGIDTKEKPKEVKPKPKAKKEPKPKKSKDEMIHAVGDGDGKVEVWKAKDGYHVKSTDGQVKQFPLAQGIKATAYANSLSKELGNKKEQPKTLSRKEFGGKVMDLAKASKPEDRFYNRKVYISSLWEASQKQDGFPKMSLDQFKRQLLDSHVNGDLTLSRGDLVLDMDSKKVEQSEMNHVGSHYHFVLLDDDKRKSWTGVPRPFMWLTKRS